MTRDLENEESYTTAVGEYMKGDMKEAADTTYTPIRAMPRMKHVQAVHLNRLLGFSVGSELLLERRRSLAKSGLGGGVLFPRSRGLLSPSRKPCSGSAIDLLLPVEELVSL